MIILDTHILIWWVDGNSKLSNIAKKRIEQAIDNDEEILISSISAWEIAMLVEKGRLTLTIDVNAWIKTVSEIEQVRFVPVDNKVAIESTRLPGEFHKVPADRMIIALARTLAAPLITADEKILNYQYVKTIF